MSTVGRVYSILIWPTEMLKALLYDRVPALRRFDVWANDKERQWHRRRNASLVVALRDAGLHEGADNLDAATR